MGPPPPPRTLVVIHGCWWVTLLVLGATWVPVALSFSSSCMVLHRREGQQHPTHTKVRRTRRTTCRCSSTNKPRVNHKDDDDDDDEYLIDPAASLRKALHNRNNVAVDPQFADPSQNDVSQSLSPYDLEQYLQQQAEQLQSLGLEDDSRTNQDTEHGPASSSSTEDDDDNGMLDGVQLDSDDYVELSQYVGDQDPRLNRGGMGDHGYNAVLDRAVGPRRMVDRAVQERYQWAGRRLAQPPPSSLNGNQNNNNNNNVIDANSAEENEPSLQDLLNAWQTASLQKNRTSEELHRQVFQEEQGFLQQSQLFRESLTNASKTREALAKRHKAAFETRQTAAQIKLQEQLQELQALRQDCQDYTCSSCQAILTPDEWDTARRTRTGKVICNVCFAEQQLVRTSRSTIDSPQTPNTEHPLAQNLAGVSSSSNNRPYNWPDRSTFYHPRNNNDDERNPNPPPQAWRRKPQNTNTRAPSLEKDEPQPAVPQPRSSRSRTQPPVVQQQQNRSHPPRNRSSSRTTSQSRSTTTRPGSSTHDQDSTTTKPREEDNASDTGRTNSNTNSRNNL